MPTALAAETIIDPRSACQKVLTAKPSMKVAANQNNEALITKVNRPRVRMFIGRVRMIKIGFTTKLSSPRTTAAMIAG